jgi:hypothetical protein
VLVPAGVFRNIAAPVDLSGLAAAVTTPCFAAAIAMPRGPRWARRADALSRASIDGPAKE